MNKNKPGLKGLFSRLNITLAAAIVLFLLFFLAGSLRFKNFASMRNISNLFMDNAHLMIVTMGETLTLILGCIDLSVGAVMCFTITMGCHLITNLGVPPLAAALLMVLAGMAFGAFSGYLVTYRGFQPFIATLISQYIARGAGFLITQNTISITHPAVLALSKFKLKIGGFSLSFGTIVSLIIVVIFYILTTKTNFGRNVFAVGGNENAARLMGIPVKRTKMLVFIISGLVASIAGIVFGVYMLASYGLYGDTLHLDAVSAAVIGGTLTTGGVGNVVGSLFGVMTYGTIKLMIMYQGNLNSGWSKLTVSLMLLLFILLQKIVVMRREKSKKVLPVTEIDTIDEE